jgi:hypothetical protein
MMVLMLGSLIAIFSTNISTIETRVANNEKNYTSTFYESDAGIAPGVKVLLDTFANRAVGTYPALQWTNDTLVSGYNNLIDEVIGSAATTYGRGFTFQTLKNDGRGFSTEVRIQRDLATTRSTGSSTEFGAGFEGVGYGSAGGVHIYYSIRPAATGPAGSAVAVEARYRKVPEVGQEN